jgi:hypothetical protein
MQEKPREFPGVDRKARMQLPSKGLPLRPAAERILDFNEVVLPLDPERAVYEASR